MNGEAKRQTKKLENHNLTVIRIATFKKQKITSVGKNV